MFVQRSVMLSYVFWKEGSQHDRPTLIARYSLLTRGNLPPIESSHFCQSACCFNDGINIISLPKILWRAFSSFFPGEDFNDMSPSVLCIRAPMVE